MLKKSQRPGICQLNFPYNSEIIPFAQVVRTPTMIQWCQKEFTPLNRGKYFAPSGQLTFFYFFLSLQMALIKIMFCWMKSTYQTFHKWYVIYSGQKKKGTDLGGANKSFPIIVRQFFLPILHWYYSGSKKNVPLSIGEKIFRTLRAVNFLFLITVEHVNFWHLREQYILVK